jgi:hypothetical protein
VPKGDWTKYEIRVVGQQYTIIRDGQVLNEFDNSIDKESSRGGDPPTQLRRFAQGYIGLQNHGSSDLIDYRRISVLDLDADARVGTGPFQVTGNGAHTVEYRSRDLGGNVEEKKVVTFRIGPDAGPGPGESGTNPPPTGSGNNPPVIDTPASFKLGKVASRMKARSLAKKGLKVTVACTGGLRGTAKLTVAGKARKRLGRKTIARRSVQCFGQEKTSVRLKVSKPVARKLRKSKRTLKATLRVSMGEPGQKAVAAKKTIRLTR